MRKLAIALQNLSENLIEWALDRIKEHAEPVKKRKVKISSMSDPKTPLLKPGGKKEFDPITPILKRTE